VVGFVVAAIVIPLLVNEAGDLTRSLARCLLRWGARRIGQQLAVSAEIDETLQPELAATATASAAVPGKLSAASCAFVRSARTCMPTAWVTTVP
jgi:hypothetical protein